MGGDVFRALARAPPASDGTPAESRRLWAAIEAAFAAEGGRMTIRKDVGLFVSRPAQP